MQTFRIFDMGKRKILKVDGYYVCARVGFGYVSGNFLENVAFAYSALARYNLNNTFSYKGLNEVGVYGPVNYLKSFCHTVNFLQRYKKFSVYLKLLHKNPEQVNAVAWKLCLGAQEDKL